MNDYDLHRLDDFMNLYMLLPTEKAALTRELRRATYALPPTPPPSIHTQPERKTEVSNRKIDILSRLRTLEAELAKIEQYPPDDHANGTVLRVVRHYVVRGEPKEYTFAVVKADDHWYVTGLVGNGVRYTYDALVTWFNEADGVDEVAVMNVGDVIFTTATTTTPVATNDVVEPAKE